MKNFPKLEPWQEKVLKGIRKGDQLKIIGSGRRQGKSVLSKIKHNQYMLDTMLTNSVPWDEWRSTYSLWPRRSVMSGEWLFGRMCKRKRTRYIPWNDPKGKVVERQYASTKEVFMEKLKNGNIERNNRQ